MDGLGQKVGVFGSLGRKLQRAGLQMLDIFNYTRAPRACRPVGRFGSYLGLIGFYCWFLGRKLSFRGDLQAVSVRSTIEFRLSR